MLYGQVLILNLSMKKSESSKVLHLIKAWIMAIKYSLLRMSEYVRARGEYFSADSNGNNNYLHLTFLARYRVNSSTRLRVKRGFINGPSGDLSVLSRNLAGYFGGKVGLSPTVRDFYID